ncbi:MAG: FecR family protein [Oryzomonas sp.]|uniref:FecR family protein n=1 Tax=Oryzomonas sp. TaxID=2855186 RepID=UPI0028459CDE|nr:FecR family protein [Oryzomonas sp.]MDR3580933.1 FecR family protein [Oryzomonas sp.]
MKIDKLGLILYLLAISPAVAANQQPDAIGHIQTLKGAVSIQRGSNNLSASVGIPVLCNDTVRTGKAAAASVVMSDDSTLALGPNSELALKDYIFNPKEGKFSFVTRMAKGTFSYLSGIIGKLSPGSIRIETPEATIAVRGTKLLVSVEE